MSDESVRVPITLGQLLAAVLAVILTLALGTTALVAFYLAPIFDRQEEGTNRSTCSLEANGAVWQAIAESLDAPPAPSTGRQDAVKKIKREARRFSACR